MNVTIGKTIQQLRKQKGLSQQELAESLNISRQAISKWELDQTLPDLQTLVMLSELFDVSITYMIGVEEKNEQIVPITYPQMQTIVDNMQKQNKKRTLFELFLITLLIGCMFFMNMRIASSQIKPALNPQNMSQNILKETYYQNDHLSDLLFYGNQDQTSTYFEVSSYDLDNWLVTLDYQIVLKQYSKTTEIYATFNDDLVLPFEKVSDQTFKLTQTIPLNDYFVTLSFVDKNTTRQEKLNNTNYLTHAIYSQIYLYVPFEDGKLQLNELVYQPDFSQTNNPILYKGTLDGTLTIRLFDKNNRYLTDRIDLDMSKSSIQTLNKAFPINEEIYITLEYTIPLQLDNVSGKIERTLGYDENNSKSYFIIKDDSQRYDICFKAN